MNKKYEYIILDIETSKRPNHFPWKKDSFISSVGIEFPDKTNKLWFFNPLVGDPEQHWREIQEILMDVEGEVVGQNFQFDMTWLYSLRFRIPSKIYCLMINKYLLSGQVKVESFDLNSLAKEFGIEQKLDEMAQYWENGYETDQIPLDVHKKYLRQDLNVTHQVYLKQRELIKQAGLKPLSEVTCDMSKVLAIAQLYGAPFNTERAEEIVKNSEKIKNELLEKLRSISDIDFNPRSATQLRAVLYGGEIKRKGKETYTKTLKSGEVKEYTRNCDVFDKIDGLGFVCPDWAYTEKENESTSKDTLRMLEVTTQQQQDFKDTLLEIKKEEKNISTLNGKGDGAWIKNVMGDGKIHSSFNLTFTKTGRQSSSNPNLYNIPRKGNSPLKKVFAPSSSDYIIINADLAQVEWKAAAEICRDETMVKELIEGLNIHDENTVGLYGVPREYKYSDVKEERDKFAHIRNNYSKVITFGWLYQRGVNAFINDPEMPKYSREEWKDIINKYNTKYPGVLTWRNKLSEECRLKGFYRTPSGRIIPEIKINWDDPKEVASRSRELANYPIQSFGTADIEYVVATEFAKRWSGTGEIIPDPECYGFLYVYDSLVFMVHKEKAVRAVNILLDIFEELSTLITQYFGCEIVVPFSGEVEIGPDYSSMNEVNKENVEEVLQNILKEKGK